MKSSGITNPMSQPSVKSNVSRKLSKLFFKIKNLFLAFFKMVGVPENSPPLLKERKYLASEFKDNEPASAQPSRPYDYRGYRDFTFRCYLNRHDLKFPIVEIIKQLKDFDSNELASGIGRFEDLEGLLSYVADIYFEFYVAPDMKKNLKSGQHVCFTGCPYKVSLIKNFPVSMTD